MKGVRVGDSVVITGRSFNRRGLIVGVYTVDGTPPYLVRWCDDHREAMFQPGAGTRLLRRGHLAMVSPMQAATEADTGLGKQPSRSRSVQDEGPE
jgi:hypothetical protein